MRKKPSEPKSRRNAPDEDAAVEHEVSGITEAAVGNAGADDDEQKYWPDDYYRCPICSRMVSPGRDEVCEHYQAVTWDGEVMWSDAADVFNEAWDRLYYLGQEDDIDLVISPDRIGILSAPKKYHRLLTAAFVEEDRTFWTDEMSTVYRETEGMLSGSGEDCFHENPNRLLEIAAELNAASDWLTELLETRRREGTDR